MTGRIFEDPTEGTTERARERATEPAAVADLVVAVDCSTTGAKAVVQDSAGAVVAQASRPLTTRQPHAAWHEQDAEDWWTATRDAVAEAVAGLDDPGRVGAVCLTHQRETFVCLDASGRPLRPAILWVDGRAHEEIGTLGSSRVHELSGKPPDTTPAIYKIAWLARHEPGVLRDAAMVGDVHAYLGWRLTGRWATSEGSADTLGLFDLQRTTWSPELLDLAGLHPEQMPALVPVGDRVADVTPEVARALGLPRPVPLVSGIGDGQAAGLGLGATEPGVAYLNLGTSMVLGVGSDAYRWDPAFRTMAGMRPGTFTLETVLNAAAYVATWCRTEFGDAGVDGARGAELEAAATRVPIGAEGLLTVPYWNAAQTPYWDPQARGVTVGWHGRHTRAHLYRSILEGVGFELRLHLERLEAVTGEPVRTIRVVGGGGRSALWVQVVADITGRPVRVCADAEWSAAGAAVLARAYLRRSAPAVRVGEAGEARAAGAPGTGGPADDVAEPVGRDVLPDPTATERYAAFAAVHRRIYPALRDLFPDLLAATATATATGSGSGSAAAMGSATGSGPVPGAGPERGRRAR